MARKTLRRLIERPLGSEWDRLVRRVRRRHARRFLIFWNRGLGDIALGLCHVVDELRRIVPHAEITMVTRADLACAFALLPIDRVQIDPEMKRSGEVDAARACRRIGLHIADYDVILPRPDPTHWFRNRPASTPRLHWSAACDHLADRFDDAFAGAAHGTIDIGVHVQSETGVFYSYRKDWPLASWQSCFEQLQARHPVRFVLLGHRADHRFDGVDCVDLRGRTSFLEMMSVIRNRCPVLVAPDSGVLTMTYFLDVATPIDVVSLWADPRQGVLKHAVASPNPLLRHRALLAPDEIIQHLRVETVVAAVGSLIAPRLDEAQAPPSGSPAALAMEPS